MVKPSLSPAMLALAQVQRLNGLDGMDCSISWAFILACVACVESKGEGEKKGEGIGENRIGNSLFISLSRFSFSFATQATCF